MKHIKSLMAIFLASCLMMLSCQIAFATEPIANDFVKTTQQNTLLKLQSEDFQNCFVDMDGEAITKIKFVSLPGWFGEGKLLLNGEKVKKNQEISIEDTDNLCFQPKKNYRGKADLSFQASDGKDFSNRAMMTIIVDGESVKQTAALADKSVTVYENSPKSFCVVDGMLKLAEKQVKLISKPTYGTVDVFNDKTGEIVYTPNRNYTGEDNFIVSVKDSYGNRTNAAVSVMVVENIPAFSAVATREDEPVQIVYSDLENHWAEYSAVKLAQSGVVVGETLQNDTALFHPNEVMNRAEFYHMLLASVGVPLSDSSNKVFADCKNEPDWIGRTANTAYEKGLLKGYAIGDKTYFKPYNVITRAEAAVILNGIVAPQTASCVESNYKDMSCVPTWAVQSVKNMTACGILKGNEDKFNPQNALTRAEAAELCFKALQYAKTNLS